MSQASMPGEPTEAELRAMLAELREAPAEEVLAQAANMLLQAAQVKLGRPDARLLIDAVAAFASSLGDRARGGLGDQIGQAVTQLRMAQVEAERELGVAAEDAPASAPGAAAGDAAGDAPPPGPGTGSAPPPAPPSAASRLWVPGR
mgnify:CR=1 FL=1